MPQNQTTKVKKKGKPKKNHFAANRQQPSQAQAQSCTCLIKMKINSTNVGNSCQIFSQKYKQVDIQSNVQIEIDRSDQNCILKALNHRVARAQIFCLLFVVQAAPFPLCQGFVRESCKCRWVPLTLTAFVSSGSNRS